MADEAEKPEAGRKTEPDPASGGGADAGAAEDAAASAEAAAALATGVAVLAGRYYINPANSLPELDTPSAKAYGAEDRKDHTRQLFALIPPPEMPVRSNVMAALKGVQSPGLMQLVEWDAVYWPPLKRKVMAVVYERPMGGRVMPDLKSEVDPIHDADFQEKIITPLFTGLKELVTRGVTHRAIRPTNLFYMDEKRDHIVLGDCTTAPAAFDQPTLFETIPMAMCWPEGRGSGTFGDDLYSLGVTLLMVLLGRNPVAGRDEESLLKSKIEKGTYATLVSTDLRLPLSLMEVLRGLMCDDERERWTAESLELWLSGRRLSPLQAQLDKRAQRSFQFKDEQYYTARELAHAFSRDWEATTEAVKGDRLELWLKRALDDKDKSEALAAALRLAGLPGGGDESVKNDILVTQVCMILDPKAPIRYKGFACTPDGFGTALALAMARARDMRLFIEVLTREIPRHWFESRTEYSPENTMQQSNFRDLRNMLQQPGMGFGLERCLYELNDSYPCQSPLLVEDYVVTIKELLPALNEAAKRVDPKTWPMDRHIAAFVAARFSHDIDRQLDALNDTSQTRSLLGMLSLLALIQWRLGPDAVFGLASWLGGLLGPVINSYHNRDRRKRMERDIPRFVRKGSLPELYNMIDNPEERTQDEEGFKKAVEEFLEAEREARSLDTGGAGRGKRAERAGQLTAAVTSVVVALITFSLLIANRIW